MGRMATVDSFLCWELEAGGIFIGWLGKISSGITIAMHTIVLLYSLFAPCNTFRDQFVDMDCWESKGIVSLVAVIITLPSVYFYTVNDKLLQGIEKGDPNLIRPAHIWSTINFALSMILLLLPIPVLSLLIFLISFYIMIILYSLRLKYSGKDLSVAQYNKFHNTQYSA